MEGSFEAGSRSAMAQRYADIRRHTLALTAPLSAEDSCVQSMPDASPAKWHLAHTTWFFETFVLDMAAAPFDPEFGYLFNSYYEALGPRQPRPQRGLLTRPSLARVLEYRAAVDARISALLRTAPPAKLSQMAPMLELGLQHEQQHQELMLTDLLHLFAQNPTAPAYTPDAPAAPSAAKPLAWVEFPAAIAEIGIADTDEFFFDNEGPRHRVAIEPFRLASRLVTNGEYRAFIEAGGYTRPEFWLSEGWNLVRQAQWSAPIYWRSQGDGTWANFGLGGLRPLDEAAPVANISFHEATAYAAWAGARLPTEAEWEVAATSKPSAFEQLFDSAWQWTRSAYAPYPRYRPAAGAVGEYNGKFMVNQLVLRGGSFATPTGHTRPTYRNFFPADARWQFAGLRLAVDL
jgi:ergothioneine biosynthesis protein EgtB